MSDIKREELKTFIFLVFYVFGSFLISFMFQDVELKNSFICSLIVVSFICFFISYNSKGGKYEK